MRAQGQSFEKVSERQEDNDDSECEDLDGLAGGTTLAMQDKESGLSSGAMNAVPRIAVCTAIQGGMSLREAVLVALLTAMLALGLGLVRPSGLSNDSFQYLSVAANVAQGQGIETPLVHFDSERSIGRIPAPMTTFAPGYPVVVALSSFLAGSAERGARLISIAASALSVILIWALANFAGLDRTSTRVAMALLIGNAFFLHTATSVAPEPLFLLVSLSALLVVAVSIHSSAGQSADWTGLVIGQILVAASYSIRYAGIFVFAAVLAHAAASFALLRNKRALVYLLSNLVSGALIGSIMMRNWVLVGTWKGGNEKQVSHSLPTVLAIYVKAQIHLLFGMHIFDLWLICVIALSALAILWAAVTLLRNRPHRVPSPFTGAALFFIYALVSTAGMIWLGMTSVISFGTRMFYPLLPLYIVAAVLIVSRGSKLVGSGEKPARYRQALAVLFLVLYGWVNLREFNTPREPSGLDNLRDAYAKPMANGQPLHEWIDANIGNNEAIVADAGQITGYFLERPTLSLIESEYSTATWDQQTVTTVMHRFHARFLILNLAIPAEEAPVRTESNFLQKAICCRINPGFHVVAENQDVRIFQVND